MFQIGKHSPAVLSDLICMIHNFVTEEYAVCK